MPNRLASEKSPYLLQHAENPVDWMPWGDEAFARAKAEDKPILVSIGYSTCHWCHVMEHQSFSVPEVAALMNRHLVCIKVDREERPDVDRVYMNAVTALTGQGGWPLNAFLTPDGRPFYGGTYFPPQPAFQRHSWSMLVEAIGKAWADPAQRERLLKDAETVTAALKQLEKESAPADQLDPAALDGCFDQLKRSFDKEQGGFAYAPKFPMPVYQHLLLRLTVRYALDGKTAQAADSAELVLHTLRQMARGGIYDHLGGGFARYSTDDRWHVPHFEKMLYDNAQLAMNYTEAWQLSGEAGFAETLRGILAYVLRDLRAPGGAFYSAEDADSLPAAALKGGPLVKREGAFYVWTKAEILELLGPENGELFCGSYGVEAHGNVQDDPHNEFHDSNVLYDRRGTLAALTGGAAELTPEHLDARLAAARLSLFEARAKRPRPQRDDKVLAGWNGLMIAALAKAGAAFGEEGWLKAAREAAEFFLAVMWEPERGLLWRRWAAGERAIEGQADDYAFLALGLFELHQADLDPRWLRACEALLGAAREHFYDEKDGLYFLAGRIGDPRLPVRVKDSHDNVEPAPASVFSDLQLRLWALTGEARYREDAERTLKGLQPDLLRAPRALPRLAASLDLALGEPVHVVLAGRREAADTKALLKVLQSGFRPRQALLLADPDDSAGLPGYAQGFKLVDGKAAAYVCKGMACQAPVTTPEALAAQLKGA